MTSNGTLKDGCDERHDVRFRKRWRYLLLVKMSRATHFVGTADLIYLRKRTRQPTVGASESGQERPLGAPVSARPVTRLPGSLSSGCRCFAKRHDPFALCLRVGHVDASCYTDQSERVISTQAGANDDACCNKR